MRSKCGQQSEKGQGPPTEPSGTGSALLGALSPSSPRPATLPPPPPLQMLGWEGPRLNYGAHPRRELKGQLVGEDTGFVGLPGAAMAGGPGGVATEA